MKSLFASLKRYLDRNPAGRLVVALAVACVLAGLAGLIALAVRDRPVVKESSPVGPRFVIISDLHAAPGAFDQLEAMTDHVIKLRPAFAVVLGDIGNDEVPGASEKEIEAIRECFNRMRAAQIEIFPVMGNHDVHHRVQDIKVNWFLNQTPLPLNHLFDASKPTPAYRTFTARGPYDYSFNRGGIHFAVIDSNIAPPKPDWPAERLQRERPRWDTHLQWMKNDLCRHTNNPRRLPTLVFLHGPEYLTGDRGMDSRPLGRVLEECRDQQTVRAAFGGHWHTGANLSTAWDPAIRVYATQASVHPATRPVQFIVAEIGPEGLTLEPRDSLTGQPSTGPVKYHAIPGRFTDLRR